MAIMLRCFVTIPDCDRRTDGQNSISHVSIAVLMRDKSVTFLDHDV